MSPVLNAVPDLAERGLCHFTGGLWRVPHPGGAAADLARACAGAGAAPGADLPEALAGAGLAALIRPGAAVLLARPAQRLSGLALIGAWEQICRETGHPPAALSLLQPVADLPATCPEGWQICPLFTARRL